MFSWNGSRNEGTFVCSPGTTTGTRVHSPKNHLLSSLELIGIRKTGWFPKGRFQRFLEQEIFFEMVKKVLRSAEKFSEPFPLSHANLSPSAIDGICRSRNFPQAKVVTNSASSEPTRICRLSRARSHRPNTPQICSLTSCHIGMNAPKFVPSRWG